jgi:FAD/FMN-containing dehydrogenase
MDAFADYRAALGDSYVLTGEDTVRWQSDWTGQYRAVPLAVLRPGSTEEVSACLRIASQHGHAVVPASGLTGLNGATITDSGIILSLDRMNKVLEIRPEARIAIVEAGAILANVHDAAEAQDLVFPLTFGAKGSACIGGCLGTNAGGSNVLRYGNTRDLVLGIEVVLADGQVMNLMSELHKDNSGYNLKHLMIGSEGTLGIITKAVLKLVPKPKAVASAMVAAKSLDDALTLLNRLQIDTGGKVEAFEYMPREYFDTLMQIKPGTREPFESKYETNIFVEVASTMPGDAMLDETGAVPLVENFQALLMDLLEEGALLDAVVAQNEAERREMWARREAAAEVQMHHRPLLVNDIALPLDKVSTFLTRAAQRLAAFDAIIENKTVCHLGDGNIHYVQWLHPDKADQKNAIMEAVEDLVLQFGGSFSAEHGIGVSKLPSMTRRKDKVALAAMHAVKSALDPQGILNPGKLLPAP